jgi:hypothetical protein
MKTFILFFTFYFINLNISNAQFTKININTYQGLGGISKVDNNIIVHGSQLFAVASNDDFASYHNINMPSPPILSNRLIQIDSNILYLYKKFGGGSSIHKSVDGGVSWIKKLDSTSVFTNNLIMFDNNNGILIGANNQNFVTSDGWNNWQILSSWITYPDQSAYYKDSFVCIGYLNGFAYSTNKGQTFNASVNNFPTNSFQNSINILNDSTVYSVSSTPIGDHFFSHSFNKGKNFIHKYFINPFDIDPKDVKFISESEGYVIGQKNGLGTIFKTLDTGNTWQIIPTPFTEKLGNILFINDTVALISGDSGLLFRWNKNNFATNIVNNTMVNIKASIYPNPTSSSHILEIKTNTKDLLIIVLLDNQGKKLSTIYNQIPNSNILTLEQSISDLPNNIYNYQIIQGGTSKIQQFIKN